MGRKTYKAEQIIGKLQEVEVLLSQGSIVGVDQTEKAVQVLRKNWVHTFGSEIYAL